MGTEQKRAFIINTIYFLIITAIFILIVKYALPLLAPFVLAFIIASILHRPICSLEKKLRVPYKPTALLTVFVFYCTIGVLISFLILRALGGIQALIEFIPRFYDLHLEPAFTELFVNLENTTTELNIPIASLLQDFDDQFMQGLGSFISSISSWAVGAASSIATSIPGLFLQLILMIISTFFIAADYDVLTGFCMRHLNEKGKTLFIQIKKYLVGTLFVCIGSYAIIATITFIELSIGLSLIGVDHAILIAALIAIFDILPVLGTGGIMIPWGLISLLRGDFSLGLALLLLYVIITIIRNIVEPKFVGSQLGLHPVVTLASMFAGVQLFGFVGLFGFPIGLSLLRYLNDNGSIHILNMETAKETENGPKKK